MLEELLSFYFQFFCTSVEYLDMYALLLALIHLRMRRVVYVDSCWSLHSSISPIVDVYKVRSYTVFGQYSQLGKIQCFVKLILVPCIFCGYTDNIGRGVLDIFMQGNVIFIKTLISK